MNATIEADRQCRRGAAVHRPVLRVELFSLLLLLVTLAGGPARGAEPLPPNILFLLADDLGSGDVGFNGGKEIRTPHLDRLAASGAVFSQFYVQPLCSPTRAALLTGRYPMRHGLQVGVVRPWAQYGLPLSERTLPQALREAGYRTAMVGKWHLGHFRPEYLPTRRGFDIQYGHYNGALDYFTHVRDGGFDWHRNDEVSRDEGYATALVAREAVRILKDEPRTRPLFLYVPFNAVHAPHQVPPQYKKPYANLPEPRRTYAGMLAAMDEAIGEIVATLDATGRRTNTLVIFCSDNGGPQPGRVSTNGTLRAGKGTLYEGGVRVCALASWPGKIPAGLTVKTPLHIVDWYPTLLKLAGAKADPELALDGRDLWPALANPTVSIHDAILLNSTPRGGAIRMGDWKLLLNGATAGGEAEENAAGVQTGRPAVELFNLQTDPSEKTNLATLHPKPVAQLRARYDEFARQAVAPRNAPKPAGFKTPTIWGARE